MDEFDYGEPARSGPKISAIILNVLTVVVLIATLCIAGYFLAIFVNPSSSLNLFPPPTLPPTIALPTFTPTAQLQLPATWTPSPTEEPTATETPRPTATQPPTETPFSLFTPSATPEVTEETTGGKPFEVDQGSPVAISSVTFHPEAGCNWMSVAGQVLDMSGAPLTGVVIKLSGILAGSFREETSLSGVAPQYGQAGYEFFLAEEPVASNKTLWLQLFDVAGLPMSEKVYFETHADCEKNLVFVNFRQVR
jgi:hypothetical protein